MPKTSINKNTSLALKGTFAMVILLHHFTTILDFTLPHCGWLKYVAFPLVGAFFFLSGYGLTYGLMHKDNYLKGFIPKRFSKVLVPFVIVAGVATAVFSLVSRHFVNAFSIHIVQQFWFVYVILGAYLLFYLAFKRCRLYTGAAIILAASIVYSAVCMLLLPERDEMFASAIAFPLGIIFKALESKFVAYFQKKHTIKCICLFLVFFAVFGFRLFLAYKGIHSLILHTLLRNLVTALFVFFIGVFAQKAVINNRLLLRLGACSYEIYIIHPVLIKLAKKLCPPVNNAQLALLIAIVVAVTLISAFLLNYLLTKFIFNGGKQNVKKT